MRVVNVRAMATGDDNLLVAPNNRLRLMRRLKDHYSFERAAMLTEHEIQLRVRYQETDGQGRLHHTNFFNYFEMGRTELLRAEGYTYRQIESEGWMLVVSEITCQYYLPAVYDDLLRLRTTVVEARGARVVNEYQVFRGDTLLAEGRSVVACVNREGRVTRLPERLLLNRDPNQG
jgi:acyl-CoA thioester hydrolase